MAMSSEGKPLEVLSVIDANGCLLAAYATRIKIVGLSHHHHLPMTILSYQ
jgi:hypothetical protein